MYSLPQCLADVSLGMYVSLWKVLLLLVVFGVWARALTWIDKDAKAAYLPREWINLGLLVMLVVAMALVFVPLPFYLVFPLILMLFGGSMAIYLGLRQSKVGLGDLKKSVQQSFTASAKSAAVAAAQQGATLRFFGEKNTLVAVPELNSPNRAAYVAAEQVLADALLNRAQRIDLAPSNQSSQLRFAVDGLTYNALSISREVGALAVTFIKRSAGMDLNERRKPQTGRARVKVGTAVHELKIITQGSTAGEFLKIIVDPKTQQAMPLDKMGLTPQQVSTIEASIAQNRGLVLASSPKGQGLTTLLYAMIRRHDAFLQQIQTIERNPGEDIEGIVRNKLPVAATKAEERKLVDWVCSQQPDVLLVEQVEDSGSAQELVRFAHPGEEGAKRLYVGLRAGSAFETIAAWRRLVGQDDQALRDLCLVVSGRLVRRLCGACKEAYTPDAEMLRKLNISVETATTFYQERHRALLDAKGRPVHCEFCRGLRFHGLLGIYEVLSVDDELRQAVLAGAPAQQLKTLFRKKGGQTLQELALAAVESGETSVKEMVRVLKGDNAPVDAPDFVSRQ